LFASSLAVIHDRWRKFRPGDLTMPDTVIARFAGDPADLAVRYQHQFKLLVGSAGGAPPAGLIAHTCTRTADGLVIVDAWESADQWRAMAEGDAFRRSIVESGLPEPQIEVGELINVFRQEPTGS
jgi:hypothetical protein